MTVLVLGGTAEASLLAELLVADHVQVVTSLAGAVAAPRLPVGSVRVGGFGGVSGLLAYLRENQVSAVVDATHPFAEQMTRHAAAACAQAGVPLLHLSRPSWSTQPDAASWHWVDTIAEARRAAEQLGDRVFLAIGRQSLAEFADWTDRSVLVRVIEPPEFDVPATWEVLRSRGPFARADERELMRSRGIGVLVTKDSGGSTDAKLDVAGELGVAVVMVHRPPVPRGVALANSAEESAAWVHTAL